LNESKSAQFGLAVGVVVSLLMGEGVVKLVSGSGVDDMAGVLDEGVSDVVPPPHTQHACLAVVLLDP
jgi:hypothetical protein